MAAQKIAKIINFQGLISAPFTALKENGQVNIDVTPKYVDYLVQQGVRGVFVNGTTGEGLSLTVEERKLVAEKWVEYGKDKLDLIIIHVGANSLKDAQELASHAEKIGTSGIASLPPFYYKPQSQDHLIAYLKAIADSALSLPLMLYHIPSFSGVEIQLSHFLPKARKAIPTFCGAKFTSTDVRDLLQCHNLGNDQFKLLSGFDEVLLPCLACGVTAAVGATYNFMAPLSLRVMEAFKRGDTEDARRKQNIVANAVGSIVKHGQSIAALKAAMNMLSPIDFGPPRLPLVPLSTQAQQELRQELQALEASDWSRI